MLATFCFCGCQVPLTMPEGIPHPCSAYKHCNLLKADIMFNKVTSILTQKKAQNVHFYQDGDWECCHEWNEWTKI